MVDLSSLFGSGSSPAQRPSDYDTSPNVIFLEREELEKKWFKKNGPEAFYVAESTPPLEQKDAENMTVEAMQKIMNWHIQHNRSKTRLRYINYWKEQIAYKILLEETKGD